MSDVKSETIRGVKWQFLQRVTLQPVQFIFGVLLARVMTPSEFGILSLTSLFFALAAQFKDAGFSYALIRKLDRTHTDICTVFWMNVLMSFLMALILCLCAPLFASFFGYTELINLTRVSALIMFFSSFSGIHSTLFAAHRNFRSPAIINVIAALVSLPITLWAAYAGWSYWALVLQSAVSAGVSAVLLWILSTWRPSFLFSWASLKEFCSFGVHLMGKGLITVGHNEGKNLLIGKVYSVSALGVYNRAASFASMPLNMIYQILSTVTFPILNSLQNDEKRLISLYRKYVRVSSLPICASCALLIALAEPIILLLYSSVWAECVPFVQIIAMSMVTYHFCNISDNLLLVKGRSDIVLRLSTIRISLSLIFMIPAALSGYIYFVPLTSLALAFLMISLNALEVKRLFGISRRVQLQDFTFYMIYSLAAALPAYGISLLDLSNWLKIALGVSVFIILYLLALIMSKDSTFYMLLNHFTSISYIRKILCALRIMK